MSNIKDSLGDRMKANYENRAKTYLTRRMPVILRLDGKAFHTFTRGLKRPWDDVFYTAMEETMKYLCQNIQGCKLGYQQSDEITLLLTDYDNLDTDAWFDYGVQKMCSVAASMATMKFNQAFEELAQEYRETLFIDANNGNFRFPVEQENEYLMTLDNCVEKGALFDCRCFNIPKEEVANCFIWRQQDATRNAIQMLGQTHFSHKKLDHKNQNDIQDMLMEQKGINFNDMPTAFKRGVCCVKCIDVDIHPVKDVITTKSNWVIDKEIPIFTQDRHYIERYI